MIEVRDLTKRYQMGSVVVDALNGVTIRIEKGEFVGITGPSGSGKSTLLHLIGLLDFPTAGSVSIDGIDTDTLSDDDRTLFRLERMGYIFQDYALVPELTASENVAIPGLAAGMSGDESREKTTELLDRVGLGGRLDHLPRELSGGEQQRVAIARALINRPAILLADEPCANLDTANSRVILDLLQTINREWNQTILMVSHEEWHLPYFNRVIRLQDGKLADGSGVA